MKKLILVLALGAYSLSFMAQSNVSVQDNRLNVTFANYKRVLNKTYQHELMNSPAWKNFKQANGEWYVWFNEENAKPHRAFGKPIPTSGATPGDKAMNFITSKLGDFNIPASDLVLQQVNANKKMTFVNYYQTYNGVRVLYSNMAVRLSPAGDVIMWGADVFNDINVTMTPAMDETAAGTAATAGITTPIEGISVKPGTVVLPMPDQVHLKKNIYRLVYEVNVQTTETNGVPSNWYTLVDANTGQIYLRHNLVSTCGGSHTHDASCTPNGKEDLKNKVAAAKMKAANIEVSVVANVHETDPQVAVTQVGLPNLDLTIGGTGYTLDGSGYIFSGETGTSTATMNLEGTWCQVVNDGTSSTPSFTMAVNDAGVNVLSFDSDASLNELCAYNSVNVIHDYCKTILPTFTGMDQQLTTNVDIAPHECNAFYNGASINFYVDDVSNCMSYALVADVVYHEYGHGINNEFYQDQGSFFQNGAIGEGYADVWGYAENEDPLLGDGNNPMDMTATIRRYDIDPKVYPNDIVGEVHADGEIIAGAWWDLYLNLGSNMPQMMDLFATAYYGLQATNPNGQEGQAYTEVLLDCLLADDTDADITNGTPNDAAIVAAFKLHGITLISNAVLAHTPIEAELPTTGIDISADLTLGLPWSTFLDDVKCIYQINDAGPWDTIPMVNTSGSTWDGQIPGQPVGTLVAYYVGAEDVNGVLSAVQPIQANDANPNLPYYVLVGFDLEGEEDAADFVSSFGNWNTGVVDDGATTGQWELNTPVGTFGTPGDASTMVAPDHQHTPGGNFCWVTGQSGTASEALGLNDVDAGKTTIQCDPLDLSGYDNPTISYWRWYVNNPPSGANPNADWFQVYISNDGGTSWNFVEETDVSQRAWRRNAFRVQDYTTKSNNMVMKFVVSDSIRPGLNLDGGSLIESALDDIRLWDNAATSVDEIDGLSAYALYPNPAGDLVNLSFFAEIALTDVKVEVVNNMGQIVYEVIVPNAESSFKMPLDVSEWADGLYHVSIKYDGKVNSKVLSVVK